MSVHNYNNVIPWHELRDFITERLERKRNDEDSELDPIKSAWFKGQICELKALLNLPEALTALAEAKEADENARKR